MPLTRASFMWHFYPPIREALDRSNSQCNYTSITLAEPGLELFCSGKYH